METSNAQSLADKLSRAEREQLKLFDRGRRTNERLNHDGAAVRPLIELQLAQSQGLRVSITTLGYMVLTRI